MSQNCSYDYIQRVNMLIEQGPVIIKTTISSDIEHHNQTILSLRNPEQHEMDSRMVWQQRQKKSSKQPKQSNQLNSE